MLSKELFDEFMRPYYETLLPNIREVGTLAIIDSDGDISTPASWFESPGCRAFFRWNVKPVWISPDCAKNTPRCDSSGTSTR